MSVENTPLGLAYTVAGSAITFPEPLDIFEDFTPVVGGKHYIAFVEGGLYEASNPVQITAKARAGRVDYARKSQTKMKRSVSISVPVVDAFGNPTFSTVRIEVDLLTGNSSIVNQLKAMAIATLSSGEMNNFWTSGVAA